MSRSSRRSGRSPRLADPQRVPSLDRCRQHARGRPFGARGQPGDSVPQLFIPKLIEMYRAGAFPFDRLISLYDFEQINDAVTDTQSGKAIKPVLRVRKP